MDLKNKTQAASLFRMETGRIYFERKKHTTEKILKIESNHLVGIMYYVAVLEICEQIGNCRNVRGLGKSMVVFRLFEKLRYSNERSTKF